MRQKPILLNLLAASLFLCGIFQALSAQSWTQVGSELGGESDGDRFGIWTSLSHDGMVLAAGGDRNDGGASNAGHVRVFEWLNGAWTQRGADIDGAEASEGFGTCVSLDATGTTLAVGAPEWGIAVGRVKVYGWDGNNWKQLGDTIEYSGTGKFGHSLKLSADGMTLAVGAHWGGPIYQGEVRVYEWVGSNWVQKGNGILGLNAHDNFGHSLDLSHDGNTLIAGALADYYPDPAPGYVQVFEWDGNAWQQKGGTISGLDDGDKAGWATSINANGNVVALGAKENFGSNFNYLRVFEWDGVSWMQRDSFPNQVGGWTVSLDGSGSKVAVGNPQNGWQNGFANVYAWDGSDWSQVSNTIAGGLNSTEFAYSIHLNSDGNRIAIGNIDDRSPGPQSQGSVTVYTDFSVPLAGPEASPTSNWDLHAFPNPSRGNTSLSLGKQVKNCTVHIRNIKGEALYTKRYKDLSQIHLQLPEQAGMYFIEVSTPEGRNGVVKVLKR